MNQKCLKIISTKFIPISISADSVVAREKINFKLNPFQFSSHADAELHASARCYLTYTRRLEQRDYEFSEIFFSLNDVMTLVVKVIELNRNVCVA